MTDNEIIMALDDFVKHKIINLNLPITAQMLLVDTLVVIHRQKAEIERLQERYKRASDNLKAVLDERADHTEAIKEFADKYEKAVLPLLTSATLDEKDGIYACLDILKEMAGDDNA